MSNKAPESIRVEDSREHALQAAFHITDRIVRLMGSIFAFGFFIIFVLVCFYVFLTINPYENPSAEPAAAKMEALVMDTWRQLLPIATDILRLVGPILVLFIGLAILGRLSGKNANLTFDKITSDLPSLLAVIIIVTICLLPLSGLEVPNVLNNIAMVVVGFYFGKHDRAVAQA